MPTPEVRVRLSAEGVQQVVSAFRQIQRESVTAGTRSAQAFRATNAAVSQLKSLLPALTAGAAVAGLRRIVTHTLEWADGLTETAKALGITTDFLQEMQFMATKAGAPVDELERGLAFLQRRIGEQAQKGEPLLAFTDGLTVSATRADGSVRSLEEVVADLAALFPRFASEENRAAAAADVLGTKNRQLISLFAEGTTTLEAWRQ
jgi:hypothetical protein